MERFRSALVEAGLDANLRAGGPVGWDASGAIEGQPVVVAIRANPTVGDVLQLAERDGAGAYKVLAAPHLWGPVRAALRDKGIGSFDEAGHLRLWNRPLMVDTQVSVAEPDGRSPRPWRLDSPSSLDVALAVLDGIATTGVRATALAIGRSPGTVSKQLAALRGVYLVDETGHPMVPALFDAVL